MQTRSKRKRSSLIQDNSLTRNVSPSASPMPLCVSKFSRQGEFRYLGGGWVELIKVLTCKDGEKKKTAEEILDLARAFGRNEANELKRFYHSKENSILLSIKRRSREQHWQHALAM